MPLYYFKCKSCSTVIQRILATTDNRTEIHCEKCGDVVKRIYKPATTQTKEVLDNGIMVRRIERFSDAEEVYAQHAASKDDVDNNH